MPNSVSAKRKEILEIVYEGDQTYNTVNTTTTELGKVCTDYENQKRKFKILADISGLGYTNIGSRRALVEVVKNLEYEKIAFFGGNIYSRHLVDFVIQASGRMKKAKVFETKNDALNWLKEKSF